MRGNMNNLVKQAQALQANMQKAQAEIARSRSPASPAAAWSRSR